MTKSMVAIAGFALVLVSSAGFAMERKDIDKIIKVATLTTCQLPEKTYDSKAALSVLCGGETKSYAALNTALSWIRARRWTIYKDQEFIENIPLSSSPTQLAELLEDALSPTY